MEKTYTLGLYEKAMPKDLTWKEKMLAAKEAGFDFIEISIDETDDKLKRLDISRQERLALVDLMAETGVPIRTMCLSGHRKYPLGSGSSDICAKGMDSMEKAIQLAEDLGIRIIQLAGYDVYYERSSTDTEERFGKNLKKAVEMAAGAGVMLGFETMEPEFMNTVGKAMAYVDDVGSPFLNVYPDLGNITNAAISYGTDVMADLETGRGHLAAMHLKETLPGRFREIPFGTGHVDFEAGIRKAWELGVRRFVTEFWYVGNPDWKEDLLFANRMMSKLLKSQNQERRSK